MLDIRVKPNRMRNKTASRKAFTKSNNTFNSGCSKVTYPVRSKRTRTPIASKENTETDQFGKPKESKIGMISRICLYSSMLKQLSLIDIDNVTQEEDEQLRKIVKVILDTRK